MRRRVSRTRTARPPARQRSGSPFGIPMRATGTIHQHIPEPRTDSAELLAYGYDERCGQHAEKCLIGPSPAPEVLIKSGEEPRTLGAARSPGAPDKLPISGVPSRGLRRCPLPRLAMPVGGTVPDTEGAAVVCAECPDVVRHQFSEGGGGAGCVPGVSTPAGGIASNFEGGYGVGGLVEDASPFLFG